MTSQIIPDVDNLIIAELAVALRLTEMTLHNNHSINVERFNKTLIEIHETIRSLERPAGKAVIAQKNGD